MFTNNVNEMDFVDQTYFIFEMGTAVISFAIIMLFILSLLGIALWG